MACPGGALATVVTVGVNCVVPAVGSLAGKAVSGVGDDVFSSIAQHFTQVASEATIWLWTQLNEATSVDLTNKGLQTDLVATGTIAALVTLALFLVQVIASAVRQDMGGLGRAVRGLGVGFIGAAFAVAATQILLGAVDALSAGVVQYALSTDLAGLGKKILAASALATISNPAGGLLMALIVLAAVVTIWVALMIRKMLIIIAAIFAPIAFSGSASDISRPWVKRWIQFTIALVFSKLILVLMFIIGLSVLNGSGQTTGGEGKAGQDVTNLAIGSLVLLMAGFAPWMAIKMVHFAGDEFHAIHAQAGAATASAQRAAAMPQKLAAMPSKVGGSSGSSNQTGATGGDSAPRAKPETAAPKAEAPATAGGSGSSSAASGGAAGPAAPVVAGAAVAAGAAKSAVKNAAEQAQDAAQPSSGTGSSMPRPPKSA
jgi:type IV secretion system protein TrbL